MTAMRSFAILTLLTGTFASGCVAANSNPFEQDDFAVGLETLGPDDNPPGNTNGFSVDCFWNPSVQSAYRNLSQEPLHNDAEGNLPEGGVADLSAVSNACRSEALKYLAECALPRGTSMTDPDTGITYAGWLGLAGQWRTSSLSSNNQWWVTSCLLAHLNGYGIVMPILLQGDRAELQPTSAQLTEFPVSESRAWGNLFAPNFVANVCYFDDVADTCDAEQLLDERLCGTNPSCNLNVVGNCDSACSYDPLGGVLQCGSSGNRHITRREEGYDL
ncbi:hypothetical protein [Polyangium jinanense]|uniref:Lipoprotein n=1 Tax=Polyangium jinanense TaxID=2829994 RepID=A0A9X3WYD8_9BACT|nr:hypothetical protein [Polyangium jinanense]MDC3952810.1 hypothetical protein [Polyangium jinanense]MDC3980429.1 hypothetical protein [Polyangium jinanense]